MRLYMAIQNRRNFTGRSFKWFGVDFHRSRLRANRVLFKVTHANAIFFFQHPRSFLHSSTMIQPDPRAYWNVNVPSDEWTIECPEYLCNQREKDVKILSTPDPEYKRPSWQEVRSLIGMLLEAPSGLDAILIA